MCFFRFFHSNIHYCQLFLKGQIIKYRHEFFGNTVCRFLGFVCYTCVCVISYVFFVYACTTVADCFLISSFHCEKSLLEKSKSFVIVKALIFLLFNTYWILLIVLILYFVLSMFPNIL